MSSDKTTRQEMKQPVKEKIIKTAKDLLCTMTEEELTMNLVAEKLGITAPTLYHYFTSKDELLEAGNKLIGEEIAELAIIKFPKSIPAEMKIITVMSEVIAYFKKTKLPASYLIENPLDKKAVSLDEFRKTISDLFLEYYKNNNRKISSERSAYQYLGAIASEISYHRKNKKNIPEDLPEKMFARIRERG